MLEAKLKAVTNDMDTLVKDAEALFQAASSLSGDKAAEMRKRGMDLMDTAVARVRELHHSAVANGKDATVSADAYVKENPWRVVAAAGGLGLLAGLILGSR
jgi:ElaB/YqjD/DUF883 family membrane-anchored ribosome-binding protein